MYGYQQPGYGYGGGMDPMGGGYGYQQPMGGAYGAPPMMGQPGLYQPQPGFRGPKELVLEDLVLLHIVQDAEEQVIE